MPRVACRKRWPASERPNVGRLRRDARGWPASERPKVCRPRRDARSLPASERPKVCRPNGCNRKSTHAHGTSLVQVSRLECLSARLGRAGGIKRQSQPALGMRAPPGPKYSVGGLGGVSHSRTHLRPLSWGARRRESGVRRGSFRLWETGSNGLGRDSPH